MSEMKINCVILNYNDAATTIRLAEQLCGYQCLNQVVVVDNASTDDSVRQLERLEKRLGEEPGKRKDAGKLVLLRAESNRGYGAGNNLGVEYSFRAGGATHVIIANPDVMFTESCVEEMSRIFRRHSDVGVVAASMEDGTYKAQRNAWPLRGFMRELLSMGPVSRRLFRRILEYPESYFAGKKAVYADCVHGSMLMVDSAAFTDCGGYDEGLFLYQEEAVLAWRMKTSGYRTVLLLDHSYRHEHSVSIGKTYQSQLERQKLRHESTMYYFKNYLYINRVQQLMANVWFGILLLEIRAAGNR